MADADEADKLTDGEKKQGFIAFLIIWGAMIGLPFLMSFLAKDLDASSPGYWVLFMASAGLSALPPMIALAVGAGLGFVYGAEASLLASYDLGKASHWLALIVDLTWSLPNTLFGAAVGTPIYLIAGKPSRSLSRGKAWVSFSGSFGPSLQTLGTVNLGGAGAHEPIHVLQARILGPAYLTAQLGSYVVNGLIQITWTITLGLILRLTKVRDSAWFRPARDSVVKSPEGDSGAGDFFGWIYRYTLMEIWAYATE